MAGHGLLDSVISNNYGCAMLLTLATMIGLFGFASVALPTTYNCPCLCDALRLGVRYLLFGLLGLDILFAFLFVGTFNKRVNPNGS